MKDQVDYLLKALNSRLPKPGLKGGVSARQLFLAIRRFVVDIADLERKGKVFPASQWDTAVQYALIEDAATIAAEDRDKGLSSGKRKNGKGKL